MPPSSIPTPPPESLAGLVERVTFFNEETNFAVLQVRVKGHRELVPVVGPVAAINPGEWLTAQGRWVQDREFGRQFRSDWMNGTAPTSREGIQRYLGSGLIKGIGPTYAEKLVARFGEKIFDIIESESARLEQVEGIGPKRRQRIRQAWGEQKAVREIMLFLHSHGVSTSRALRIHKIYKDDAIDRVRSNPYALARDIHGIGFHTADQIAAKLGIPPDSLARACAGLSHVLLEATGQGHCALPEAMLIQKARELLEVPESILRAGLERTLSEGDLVREVIEDLSLIFLSRLRRAEEGIAARVKNLVMRPPPYPPIDVEKAVGWCQEKTGKTLAPSQQAALRQILAHRLVILTGGPGVGKTTLVNAVLKILLAKKVKCLLAAPTGRAAKRLEETTGQPAATLHRLLEVNAATGTFSRNEGNPLECDLLVVDETSMVDVPLMHHVLRALPAQASLLLVGDVDQLPSVGPGLVLGQMIQSGVVPVVRLTEVFRQASQSQIIAAAHRINQGQLPVPAPPHANALSDFYTIERADPLAARATLLEMVLQRIPARFRLDPIRDIQVLCPMNRGSLGTRELNEYLQAELNPRRPQEAEVEKFGWKFRPRDKVIQTENNYDKEVFNGDIGQVTRVDPDEREVTITFDRRTVVYDFGELDEVSLAYAITVHKAQGSEFPAVVMPLAMQHYLLLQRNLVYTGLTRGKKLVVLIGQQQALAMAVRNHETARRYSGLLHRLSS